MRSHTVLEAVEGYSSLFPSAVKWPALVGDPGEVEGREKKQIIDLALLGSNGSLINTRGPVGRLNVTQGG